MPTQNANPGTNPNPTPQEGQQGAQTPPPTAPAAGQPPAAPQPPVATAPPPAPPTAPQTPPAQPPPSTQTVFDAAYVNELRSEAAANRVKAKELETALGQANEKISTLQTSTQTAALRAEVAIQGGKLKLVDPDAAILLMDRSAVKFADDGSVSGVEDALKKLVEAKPYLVTPDGVTTPPGAPARGDAKFTLDQVKKMTPEEIAENWADVEPLLAEQKT